MGARISFVTWDGGGNVPPVLALASLLTTRGHEVSVLGSASLEPRVAEVGVAFAPRRPDSEWDLTAQALDTAADVSRRAADLVVVDYMLPGAICGAATTAAPAVALVHTLHAANLVDGDLAPMSMAASVDGINTTRAQLGQAPVQRLSQVLDGCARVLVTAPEELDLPQPRRAPNVRYVGPVLQEPGPDEGWRPPGDDGDGPLVVVGLGTTPMNEGPVLEAVLDGLAGAPVRVVATVGDHLYPGDFRVPANAVVSDHVRHSAMLPFAAAVVTHGGLGTVLAALSHGVPLVCLPLGREQPANAAAVERVGAGVALPPTARPAEIAAAVRLVLDDAGYRTAAARIAKRVERHRAEADAEAEIERVLNGGRC